MAKKAVAKIPYLLDRGGRYFARVVIPEKLRPLMGGKKELREALGPDRRAAKEALNEAVARLKSQLRSATRDAEGQGTPMVAIPGNPIAPEKIMVHHYREMVAFDERARNADRNYPGIGDVDPMEVTMLRAGMAGRLTDDEYLAVIGERIRYYQRMGNTDAKPGTVEFRILARAVCVAEYESLSRSVERDDGDFTGRPEHPMLVEAIAADDEERRLDDHQGVFAAWTFGTVIDEQERRNAMGLGGRVKSAATLDKYRNANFDFEHFRRDKKVATVTIEDGKRWRDHMLKGGKLSRKTIKDKINAIRTLMNWANVQSDGKLYPHGEPWVKLELPTVQKIDSADRTYSLKDASHLLKCARTATRASLRWIPWIIAHTGARVNEITPLEKEDVFELEGHWFIHIRVGNGRTTKTHKARKVPVHRALIKEGFIEFVKAQPAGRLFPGGENEDQRIREWIHEKVFPDREDMPPPNHGFRHLFEDALFSGVSHRAALYITGRSSGSSADDYGGSDLRLIEIAGQMDKVREIFKEK